MQISYKKEDCLSQSEFMYRLSENSGENRDVLTNLIVINLVTVFEVYVERLLKQFIKRYNSFGLSSNVIDDRLKFEYSKQLIEKLNLKINHEHKNDDCCKYLKVIGEVWSYDAVVSINLELNFPKGKHGEVELEKLFRKIGIKDILKLVSISKESESMLDNEDVDSKPMLDVQTFIQDITLKRNLAIHQGVPLQANVSLENLRSYIDNVNNILQEITRVVNENLEESSRLIRGYDI